MSSYGYVFKGKKKRFKRSFCASWGSLKILGADQNTGGAEQKAGGAEQKVGGAERSGAEGRRSGAERWRSGAE